MNILSWSQVLRSLKHHLFQGNLHHWFLFCGCGISKLKVVFSFVVHHTARCPVMQTFYVCRKQLEINNKPKREIVLLQSVVATYKPRSDHVSSVSMMYDTDQCHTHMNSLWVFLGVCVGWGVCLSVWCFVFCFVWDCALHVYIISYLG